MVSPPLDPVSPVTRIYRFRDPTRLTRVLEGLFTLGIAINIVSVLSNLWMLDFARQLQVSGSFPDMTALAEANDRRQAVVGIAQMAMAITTIVVFCLWIYRANCNARARGAVGMTFTPGWSVGWFFVPIAMLWKPFQAMREIWKASRRPQGWQSDPTDPILGWWWFTFLLSNVLGQAAGRLMFAASDAHSLALATQLGAASDLVDVVATMVAFVMVERLHRLQTAQPD